VTAGADKDARASIRRLQRENPGCRILVTGCYAQRAPEELAALPGVKWVVGNSHKHQAVEIATSSSSANGFVSLAQLSGEGTEFPHNREERDCGHPDIVVGDIFAHTELLAAPVFEAANERTRPNLKVQDGCGNRCSFCVIPFVRGPSRSLPLERVLGEVRSLVDSGYREVVISGINLGRWGRDLAVSHQPSAISHQPLDMCGEGSDQRTANRERQTTNDRRLVDLIRAILERTSLEKLRISSVEPMDWSDELIGLMALSPRIAKHAHLPMQSASDAVLRRMHRKYRPWHYREKVLKIRAAMPTAAIGADVMVGFPGETEAEFAGTRRMVEQLPFTYLHVFTYSVRPGTAAAQHSGQVPVTVARERNRVLREIAAAKQAAFRRCLAGTVVEAITLRAGNEEFTEALTDNYLKIQVWGRLEPNQWIDVEVADGEDGVLRGQRVSRESASRGEPADATRGGRRMLQGRVIPH
jgi:threonylcarbamoyladenosine tRNA methylthiotransferase MtaB